VRTQHEESFLTDADCGHEITDNTAVQKGHVLHVICEPTLRSIGVVWQEDGRRSVHGHIGWVLLQMSFKIQVSTQDQGSETAENTLL
jgi:hypothetical protein